MQTVWITGASSGIGEAVAYQYARRGCRLILTARSGLEAVAGQCRRLGAASVCVLAYDLGSLDGVGQLCADAWDASGGIDIVFLNAGISQRTSVEDTSMPVIRKIMEVNFFAPAAIAGELLPRMLEKGGGRFAVTTSIAGHFGFPLRCAYSSSKHALYGFFETLRAEYYDKGITVTIVCPGRVRTNISVNSLDKGGVRHAVMDPGQDKGLSPGKAAQIIVRAIEHGRSEVLVGRTELLMVWIKRFFPRLCDRLSRNIKPM